MAFREDSMKAILWSLILGRGIHLSTKLGLLVAKISRILLFLAGKSMICDKPTLSQHLDFYQPFTMQTTY